MPTVSLYGRPAPKGSMKCIGSRGRGGHQLIEDHRAGAKEWRERVAGAGRALLDAGHGPYDGPLVVDVTLTIERPKSVTLADRPYPHRKGTADTDKLVRMILDALQDSGLYGDDVQVITETGTKTYPDSPGITDRLDRPGAVIRIEPLTTTKETTP